MCAFTKDELSLLHEMACYAASSEKFNCWLQARRGSADSLWKAWEKGKTATGHKFIGKILQEWLKKGGGER